MMKVKDIQMLTAQGRYHITNPLSYLKDKIEDWQRNLDLQLNPDFQRGHVWTTEQQSAFMKDVRENPFL